ncbi:MAG: nascent polypeptide-associated complex protein [Candidatus Heimdallarchaeota archaeon]|nr:nascent polypeptide-associated complex protein [Candidatus Heimdallarchaeota archaeon]
MSKRRRDARRASRRSSSGVGDVSGMSNKQMKNALNNIETEEIKDVTEVIVKTATEEIILHNPEVTIMNMGQEMWTIVPKRVEKRPVEIDTTSPIAPEDVEINEDDVKLIMSTANVSEEEAIKALKSSGGDIAAAMMNLR